MGLFLLPIQAFFSLCPGGEIGRHNGLKIRRLETAVPVQVRSRAPPASSL